MSDSDVDSDWESEYATDEEMEKVKKEKAVEEGAEEGGGATQDGDATGAKQQEDAGAAAAAAAAATAKKAALELVESTAPISVIDKRMLEELLLVVQNLGTIDAHGDFVRGPDCLQWLHDLQQVLARDDADRRHVSNFLGAWNVVPKKLVPLLKSSKDDKPLILTMLKIFFMLTKQVSRSAAKDAAQFVHPKAGDLNRKNMLERKKNAQEQAANLRAHKAAFVDGDLVGVLVEAMQEAVATTGSARTEEHGLVIELVLALVRNILAIPDAAPGNEWK